MRLAGTVVGLLLATLVTPAAAYDAEVSDVAHEAGVDEDDLYGAMLATDLGPREYLYAVGELPRPVPVVTVRNVWDRLADCEAGGNWAANTGNGFSGGLQFTRSTWASYGGLAFAAQAWLASRAAQIAVAERVLAGQGWRHGWPACSLRLGLR
jgi:hypothetical protein